MALAKCLLRWQSFAVAIFWCLLYTSLMFKQTSEEYIMHVKLQSYDYVSFHILVYIYIHFEHALTLKFKSIMRWSRSWC